MSTLMDSVYSVWTGFVTVSQTGDQSFRALLLRCNEWEVWWFVSAEPVHTHTHTFTLKEEKSSFKNSHQVI